MHVAAMAKLVPLSSYVAPTVPIVSLGTAWASAAPGTTYTGRAGKGFDAVPYQDDPSNTLQTTAGYPYNAERVIAGWSEENGMVITQEDCPDGTFLMGIEAWHPSGIHHLVVQADGGAPITIPGSALSALFRTDPVTGTARKNGNMYLFKLALPPGYTNIAAGKCQLLADVYPYSGLPARLGKYGTSNLNPSAFTPMSLFFDPNGQIPWDTYSLAPASGSPTSGVVGSDGNNGKTAPWATLSKVRTGAPSTRPVKILAYDGQYLDDISGALNNNPVPLWIKSFETFRGAKFGRLLPMLQTPQTAANSYNKFNPGFSAYWDGVFINTANMSSFGFNDPYFHYARRCSVASDYGAKNGPEGTYCSGGPRIDDQYGIYFKHGYGYGAVASDKVNLPESFYHNGSGRFSMMECDVVLWGTGNNLFVRNCNVTVGGDFANGFSNQRRFGNVVQSAPSGVPLLTRSSVEQVLKADQVTYDSATNKSTITFQNNAAGARPSIYAGVSMWVLDPASKYHYDLGNVASYYSLSITMVDPSVGSPAYLSSSTYVTLTGDYRDGIATGTALFIGGWAHNDNYQPQDPHVNYSTPANTAAGLFENQMLTHNTFLGRPASMITFSTGDVTINPATKTYNDDGSLSSTTFASRIEVATDGRTFRTTDASGNDLPVVGFCKGLGITIGQLSAGVPGNGASIDAYNATNAPIFDPVYGSLAPGHGVLISPFLDASGNPRAYAVGTYAIMIGNIGIAIVNNEFVPSAVLATPPGWNITGLVKGLFFVGNTWYSGTPTGGPAANLTPWATGAEGVYVAENILRSWYPAYAGFAFENNSLGGTGYGPTNAIEPTMTIGDPSTWDSFLRPPIPANVNKKAAGVLRRFDRYGNQIIPGVSPVGARVA